jgi:3-oxoacyl-[acyl-carrier-protein] synthase-3
MALDGGPAPDVIINASLTPVQLIPDTGVFVAKAMGLEGIQVFSVHATCLSFLVATQIAAGLLQSRSAHRVLVVSSEIASQYRDFSEPESAALLGDGAAAAVFELPSPGADSALLAFRMSTFPGGSHLAEFRGGGTRYPPDIAQYDPSLYLFHMQGTRLYRWSYARMRRFFDQFFEDAGFNPDDVDLVVPHQVSGPVLAALRDFGFPDERVINILSQTGNCVAASLPMALATANAQGRLKAGDTVLMIGTGAGVSIAAALLRW